MVKLTVIAVSSTKAAGMMAAIVGAASLAIMRVVMIPVMTKMGPRSEW